MEWKSGFESRGAFTAIKNFKMVARQLNLANEKTDILIIRNTRINALQIHLGPVVIGDPSLTLLNFSVIVTRAIHVPIVTILFPVSGGGGGDTSF